MVFWLNVAGPGVEPGLWDYEPHVHRTLPRAIEYMYSLATRREYNIFLLEKKAWELESLKKKLLPLLPGS